MTWKNLILVPFLALTPVIVGCGADCEDLCEESNDDCEGPDSNCEDSCGDIEELNEKAGCEDKFDEVMSCLDDADDICAEDQCESETTAWGTCIGTYCAANSTAAECKIDL